MTATGAATAGLLELNTTGVTWVDVSSRLQSVSIRQGRSSRFEDPSPGTLDVVLSNDDGALTPDNPLSMYYPYLTENIGIRYTVTAPGGSTYKRFAGRVTSIEPSMPGGTGGAAVVQVSAVDVLGKMARRVMRAEFIERWLSYTSTVMDLFPFDESVSNPTTFRNLGPTPAVRGVLDGGSGHVVGTATVVQSSLGTGSLASSSVDGITLDSCIETTASDGYAPIIRIAVDPVMTPAEIVIPFRTADRVASGGSSKYIAQGLDAAGLAIWSLRLVDNGAGRTDLKMYDTAGASGTIYTGFAPVGDSEPGDDQWFVLRLYFNSGSQFHTLWRGSRGTLIFGTSSIGYDIRNTRTIVLGGDAAGAKRNGKHTNCASVKFGTTVIDNSFIGNIGYLATDATEPMSTRTTDIRAYSGTIRTLFGSADPTVALTNLSGRTAFDALAEVARTVGGSYAGDYSAGALDAWTFYAPDVLRSATVALTIDATNHLDASNDFPWRRSVDSKPTRVTATWPGGTVQVIGDETLNVVDGSIDTCAATETQAASAASMQTNASSALAAAGVAIDLANASTSKWADVMGLTIGKRIRIDSLPSTYFGVTYADVYALGWTEEYTQDSARFTFDTEPADSPVAGEVGSDLRSRVAGFAVVDTGTALGTTANGTIVTLAGSSAFTQDAAAYPMLINWDGEIVTITSAPASATAPQTFTTTARGVAPSAARSTHVSGGSISPYLFAAVAP